MSKKRLKKKKRTGRNIYFAQYFCWTVKLGDKRYLSVIYVRYALQYSHYNFARDYHSLLCIIFWTRTKSHAKYIHGLETRWKNFKNKWLHKTLPYLQKTHKISKILIRDCNFRVALLSLSFCVPFYLSQFACLLLLSPLYVTSLFYDSNGFPWQDKGSEESFL